ncbi:MULTISPECIES: hypothetical protein [Bacillus cereus group]|uniref:hypothetical protein n=1 Tax=Bacillus cereus group TaxID=86661 RepID=UPI00065A43AF|nr:MULTISPECIES: hypothetical protein [Bacillus cereus group]KLA21254.1 hypothetical protein B4087_5651 [Bacillus cereus]MDA1521516.1 hypothetical protein [Bacillus cereus]MDA1813220.1 hypothetical protein [Bacillus cereus]MDA1980543.1 hypothetical protein [Bacillus cereus]SMD60783.1 hypothetical protein BACERE00195_00021 [Bacillus cereus]
MKIKDILELTQTKKVAEIAKEFLEVGEKKAVEGLKKAGCYNTSGKRGWYLAEGTDESILEQSLYDFVAPTKGKAKANVSTNEPTLQPSNVVKAIEEIKKGKQEVATTKEQTNVRTLEPKSVVRKRSSFDIDVELMKELKIQAVIHDRNIYEIVETAIRKELTRIKKK